MSGVQLCTVAQVCSVLVAGIITEKFASNLKYSTSKLGGLIYKCLDLHREADSMLP